MTSTPQICYVTAFYDIKRETWKEFSRTFEAYLQEFENIVKMFSTVKNREFELVVYIDEKRFEAVREKVQNIQSIRLVIIDEVFMQACLPMWKTLEREREIMNSRDFKNLISHRLKCPETHVPEYTLINHCKIDFIGHTIDSKLSLAEYFCWIDFGYGPAKNIPSRMIDINKLQLDKINYTIINPLDESDRNILHTLVYAPERIGGFFFFGNKKCLKEYQALYHQALNFYQKNNLADDDQALALACYWKKPELFHLHNFGEYHQALVRFQLDDSTNILTTPQQYTELCDIMNKNGSDKGSGWHNYTHFYHHLFNPVKNNKLNILEIGIGSINSKIPSNMCGTSWKYEPGSSLRGWREYFKNSNIYGCDVDKDILINSDRIKTFFLDQTKVDDSYFINAGINEVMFDIIIDDGLHDFPINFETMTQLFKRLNKGGMYIIEDIPNYNNDFVKDNEFITNNKHSITWSYVPLPNARNNIDNNLFIISKERDPIKSINEKSPETIVPIHDRNPPWTAPRFVAEVFDHIGMIVFFASWIKPDAYVEYGVSTGLVINKVAPYCKKAIGVDVNDFPSMNSNIEKKIMSTREFGKTLISSDMKIDMAFIDADHKYTESFQDFEDIFPFVSDNGFIFLHDTYPTIPRLTEDVFCSDSWKTPFLIKKHYGNVCDVLTIPVCPGLTIVRKNFKFEWMDDKTIVDPTNSSYISHEGQKFLHNSESKINLFIVTSVVNSKIRTFYSPEDRFMQTIETAKSINKYCPHSYKIIVEGSDISQEQIKILKSYFNYVLILTDQVNCSDSNISVGENSLLTAGLKWVKNSRIKNMTERIFKLSARYKLTDEFILENYPSDKYVVCKGLNTLDECYFTVLYHIPVNNIDEFIQLINLIILDIEHTLYKKLPRDKLFETLVLGFEGTYSSNGVYLKK